MSDEVVQVDEVLEKKCPRCGKPSKNSSNPSGRCSACLKKLAANKKKVGRYEHHHKVADDALRRQDGKTKTTTKKTKGRGTRKSIIAGLKREEAKTGQVLSPDRKSNSHGYGKNGDGTPNVRYIKPSLNRGRHNADPKKIAAWRKKLKKSNVSPEAFITFMKSVILPEYADEAGEILEAIQQDLISEDLE